MFGQIFRYKGPVWTVLNNITDVLFLSLLWMLCSIPLVTLGAATTALYDSVVRCVRYGNEGPYRRFFCTFRNELLTSVLSTLLWGAVILVGLYLLGSLRGLEGELEYASLAASAYRFVLVLPLGAAFWVSPILSRFSFRFGPLNLTACKFVFAHLPCTLIMVLSGLGAMFLSSEYILALLVAPALLMLLWSLAVEPVFAGYGGEIESAVADCAGDAPEQD